jgi:lysophospholipase L1-like esterase
MNRIKFLLLSALLVVASFSNSTAQAIRAGTAASSKIGTQSEYTSFETRMSGLSSSIPAAYVPLYNNLVYTLKFTLGRDGVTSYWNSLDFLRIQSTYSKTAALQNIIQNAYNGTIVNDYGGSFTTDEGLKGNGTNFSVSSTFNLSTAGKFSQNSGCVGVYVLDNVSAGNDSHEFCALKTGGTDGTFIRAMRSSANSFDSDGNANGSITGITTFPTVLSTRAWFHIERTTSANMRLYVNGSRWLNTASTSTSLPNLTLTEFAANVNSTISAWSDKTHAVIYAGNGNIEPNILIEIINSTFIYPLNNARSGIHKRLFFVGDSMVGDETNANTGLSNISEIGRRTLSQLGTDWMAHVNGDANREIDQSYLVPSISSILTTDILGYVAGAQSRFRNLALTKDIVAIFAGTNDLAFHATTTATTLKAAHLSVVNSIKADGRKVITIGAVARNGAYFNSQTTGNFAIANADWQSKMLAEYNIATGITRVWANSDGNLFIDLLGDSRFQNPANTTYFQGDQIHVNTTGSDIIADEYLAPACNYISM